MSSQLQQLKQQTNSLGQAARRNSQGLAQFNSTFTQQSPQTQATIGGSAQSKDRTMFASINKVKVHAAADALQRT